MGKSEKQSENNMAANLIMEHSARSINGLTEVLDNILTMAFRCSLFELCFKVQGNTKGDNNMRVVR